MKKYSDPKIRITNFTDESVITASQVTTDPNTLENWKTTNGGTILSERNFQEMKDIIKITF